MQKIQLTREMLASHYEDAGDIVFTFKGGYSLNVEMSQDNLYIKWKNHCVEIYGFSEFVAYDEGSDVEVEISENLEQEILLILNSSTLGWEACDEWEVQEEESDATRKERSRRNYED